MKTSYYSKFSRLNEEEKNKYYVVAISNSRPKWFEHIDTRCEYLYPNIEDVLAMKDNKLTKEEFTSNYIKQLNEDVYMDRIVEFYLNKEKIYNKEVLFICYEKSSDFCHRHILSKYIEDNFGIIVEELT